jgi:hypothetical protein
MNLYTGLMTGLILVLGTALFVNDASDELPVIDSNHAEAMATLERSKQSLDRMIIIAEEMHRNLVVMNHNSDAIFRSVTGCDSDKTCESLKESMMEAGNVSK